MFGAHQLISADPVAISSLLAEWQEKYPALGVLALVPEALGGQVAVLQALCREKSIPLNGAVFPALLSENGFMSDAFWLLRFDQQPPCFLLGDLNSAPASAADRIAEQVRQRLVERSVEPLDDQPSAKLFMIFDGMLPNIASILSALFSELGSAVRYAGVNAGSETFQAMPCLFDQERRVSNGLLALLLPATSRVTVRHEYPVSKSIMKASSTVGNRILSIDGRNAFSVYQEIAQAEYGVSLTPDNFYEIAAHYPFGVVYATDVLVRIPVAFGADGSLLCVGEIPPESMLRLLRAPAFEDSHCIAEMASALGGPTRLQDQVLLTFYCAGRRMHFKDEASAELGQLKEMTAVQQIVGALSLGEIDTMAPLGFPRFHNASLVCVAPLAATTP